MRKLSTGLSFPDRSTPRIPSFFGGTQDSVEMACIRCCPLVYRQPLHALPLHTGLPAPIAHCKPYRPLFSCPIGVNRSTGHYSNGKIRPIGTRNADTPGQAPGRRVSDHTRLTQGITQEPRRWPLIRSV
jgi:hypothetical protein